MELSIDMIYDMMKWKWGICNPDFKSFTLNVDDKEEKKKNIILFGRKRVNLDEGRFHLSPNPISKLFTFILNWNND